jgi:hypothetical protein
MESMGVPAIWQGRPWSANCREWIYYNCLFDPQALKQRLSLCEHIIVHEYNDVKVAAERGLFCPQCNDAVMGKHPANIAADTIIIS